MRREKVENIFKVIEDGYIYVGKCFDGLFVLINNKSEDYDVNCIMFNPIEDNHIRVEFDTRAFKEHFNNSLAKRIIANYRMNDSNGIMMKSFESIASIIDFLEQGNINECMIRKMA